MNSLSILISLTKAQEALKTAMSIPAASVRIANRSFTNQRKGMQHA